MNFTIKAEKIDLSNCPKLFETKKGGLRRYVYRTFADHDLLDILGELDHEGLALALGAGQDTLNQGLKKTHWFVGIGRPRNDYLDYFVKH